MRLLLLDAIFLHEHFLKGPVVETRYLPEVALAIEVLLGMLAGERHVLWHATEQLHHLGEMVIILVVVRALARLEEEVSSDHLEDGAGQAPYVS